MGNKQHISVAPITITAAAEIIANRFVGTNLQPAGAAANTLGVALHDTGSGDDVAIETIGPISVEAGAAVTVGGLVESNASGQAIDRTAGAIVGRALEAATAAGEFISVLLIRN